MKQIILFALYAISSGMSFAQIIVTPNPTASAITPLLQGSNTLVSNVVINCSTQAIATINATNSNLGLGDALFLSTGSVFDIAGANNGAEVSSNWGLPGDTDLAGVTSQPYISSYDACIVEFDVVPANNNINFQFVFASEDYPGSTNPAYQDNCGVFVSGNGITGNKNLALLPGTNTPVNAASVNDTTNSALYVDNTGGTTFKYNAFTTLLRGSVSVIAHNTYHFKIGIVDLGDPNIDSGIMISDSGFWSNQSSGIEEFGNNMINIVPSPVKESAVIELPALSAKENIFYLYNANGQMVQNEKITDTHYTFRRNDLPSGIYCMEIISGGNIYKSKLILN